MRGKPQIHLNRDGTAGNIPAHAGKTQTLLTRDNNKQEHPRACGENDQELGYAIKREGTSPRMRGKQQPHLRTVTTFRNIPAHAGKTDG